MQLIISSRFYYLKPENKSNEPAISYITCFSCIQILNFYITLSFDALAKYTTGD